MNAITHGIGSGPVPLPSAQGGSVLDLLAPKPLGEGDRQVIDQVGMPWLTAYEYAASETLDSSHLLTVADVDPSSVAHINTRLERRDPLAIYTSDRTVPLQIVRASPDPKQFGGLSPLPVSSLLGSTGR